MIHSLDSDIPTFRPVWFHKGLNLVLADRTEESTEYDSRNGLGKTSVVHLIQFCLGGSLPDHLDIEPFQENAFRLRLDAGEVQLEVARSLADKNHVVLTRMDKGRDGERGVPDIDLTGQVALTEYKAYLVQEWFHLGDDVAEKYAPTLRSLMNYFARRRHDAFVTPLKHFHSQAGYSQQILQAFLCGMDWRYPLKQRLIHEEEQDIRALRRAAESGVLDTVVGSAGEIRAAKIQIERRLGRVRDQIEAFQVHPQYQELQDRADRLATALRDIADGVTLTRRLLANYAESFEEVRQGVSLTEVERVYAELEVTLPDLVTKSIEDVRAFHTELTAERTSYLEAEITRLEQRLENLVSDRARLEHDRALQLRILRTHGSLEDLRELESEERDSELELAQVKERLATRDRIDTGGDELKARRLANQEAARARFQESNELRERIVELFDEFWEQLYGEGGRLVIDLTDSGYSFAWEVQREGSEGVGKMKIFAHDLAVATAWAERGEGPGFLIHDSTIWDGVDERQIAAALRLGRDVGNRGLQYITMMNTDVLPLQEHSDEWEEHVAIRLRDRTDEGRLFGRQF